MAHIPVGEISPDVLAEARALDRVRELDYDGLRYLRFNDKLHNIPRGTVVLGGRVIPGYPSIGRIFVLEAGVKENLRGEFYAEEKIDGYNVRVIRHAGELLALTRGGFICPFTSDRLPDLAPFAAVFDDEGEDLIVCGEVAGPDNPYINAAVCTVDKDIGFFAFDLMRCDRSGFVSLPRRERLLQQHALPRAELLGKFRPTQLRQLRQLVLDLERRGVEGVVFKPVGHEPRIKYVTPGTNLADIISDVPLLAELPEEFFELRLLRLALGLCELDLRHRAPEFEQRLGQALVSRLLELVESVRQGGVVANMITLRLRQQTSVERVLHHLNHISNKIQVREIDRRREGAYTILRLEKTFLGATSRIKTLAGGARVVD